MATLWIAPRRLWVKALHEMGSCLFLQARGTRICILLAQPLLVVHNAQSHRWWDILGLRPRCGPLGFSLSPCLLTHIFEDT